VILSSPASPGPVRHCFLSRGRVLPGLLSFRPIPFVPVILFGGIFFRSSRRVPLFPLVLLHPPWGLSDSLWIFLMPLNALPLIYCANRCGPCHVLSPVLVLSRPSRCTGAGPPRNFSAPPIPAHSLSFSPPLFLFHEFLAGFL